MNNDNFLIEDSDLELAKKICNDIDDIATRNRAVANVLAADIAKKYFTEIDVDTDSGLHKIPFVLNKLDIADIYIKDSYIDVRIYFEDNELYVPKDHFDRDLAPIAYMFIKLNSDLSGGTVSGFALSASINTNNASNGYYKISEDSLVSYYDVEAQLVSSYFDEIPDDFDIQVFNYLDGKLDNENDFYKVLLKSRYCRIQLKNTASAQSVLNNITIGISQNSNLSLESDSEPMENSLLEEDSSFDNELTLDVSSDDMLEPMIEDESENLNFEPLEEDSLSSFEVEMPIENDEIQTEDFSTDIDSLEETHELQLSVDSDNLLPEENLITDSVENDFANEISEETEEIEFTEENEEILENKTPNEIEFDTDLNSESGIDIPQEEIAEEISDEKNKEYSTNITPSLDNIESEVSLDDLENMLDTNDSTFEENENNEIVDENSQQIDELFDEDKESTEDITIPVKKGSPKLLILLLLVIAVAGYFGYTKFMNQEAGISDSTDLNQTVVQPEESNPAPVQEAMPVETVENTQIPTTSNEGNAISIPAIEQNLDASILVSNLTVNWEVPAGYVTNNTAKRYFTKVGKIIQLNLKADLLLLSKPPITNKIMVELQYDKNASKFSVKGVTASSGEKSVDDLIVSIINTALDINLKTNMNTFANISGNPVLIIRL